MRAAGVRRGTAARLLPLTRGWQVGSSADVADRGGSQARGEADLGDRVRFEVAGADDFPGTGYDLVCMFDALHDMGDPLGAARHIRDGLAPDGTWLLVEPAAGETLVDNINPVGRIFYSASVTICTPSAQAQDGGYALGNQVPDSIWSDLLADAGFTRFRRAAETPFNRVFEVRP
jgi:hypothetical protein